MFDSIIANSLNIKTVDLTQPSVFTIQLKDGDEANVEKYYDIKKSAQNFIYKKLGIKFPTSKEVYKKSQSIWKELRDNQLKDLSSKQPEDNNYFTFDKETLLYLGDSYHNIIDMYDFPNMDEKLEFESKLEMFKLDITTRKRYDKLYQDYDNGLSKLIYYEVRTDLSVSDYTPAVMMELNIDKSTYIVYSGLITYKENELVFVPGTSLFLECDSYVDFIRKIDLEGALQYSKENAVDLFDLYTSAKTKAYEISVRELTQLLKNINCKLVLRNDDELSEVQNVSDIESQDKILDFFNTFKIETGETAYDILQLNEIQKVFRYNKLTLYEVFKIISKEYISETGSKITLDTLSNLLFKATCSHNDKEQSDELIRKISNED